MKGKLWGVGVGPGDSELLTLKAVRLIEECQVLVVPDSKTRYVALDIAKDAVKSIDKKEILKVHMPMTKDKEKLREAHIKAAFAIEQQLDLGKNLVFLTLGDPTVYSTYYYVHKRVLKDGYNCEIVPGITSFCAAAARLSISLSEGKDGLYIMPGSYENIEDGLKVPGTKVIMKSGKSIGKVRDFLVENEHKFKTVMVENCGMENEKIYDSAGKIQEDASYFSLLIVKDKGEADD